jgi:methanogenic corrinoid protein MtbC1
MLGIALNRLGWRIVYLGGDTPIDVLSQVAVQGRPDLVVLALTNPQRLRGHLKQLTQLANTLPLAIAGAGATSALAQQTGAQLLTTDPVTAAEHLHRERDQDHSPRARPART